MATPLSAYPFFHPVLIEEIKSINEIIDETVSNPRTFLGECYINKLRFEGTDLSKVAFDFVQNQKFHKSLLIILKFMNKEEIENFQKKFKQNFLESPIPLFIKMFSSLEEDEHFVHRTFLATTFIECLNPVQFEEIKENCRQFIFPLLLSSYFFVYGNEREKEHLINSYLSLGYSLSKLVHSASPWCVKPQQHFDLVDSIRKSLRKSTFKELVEELITLESLSLIYFFVQLNIYDLSDILLDRPNHETIVRLFQSRDDFTNEELDYFSTSLKTHETSLMHFNFVKIPYEESRDEKTHITLQLIEATIPDPTNDVVTNCIPLLQSIPILSLMGSIDNAKKEQNFYWLKEATRYFTPLQLRVLVRYFPNEGVPDFVTQVSFVAEGCLLKTLLCCSPANEKETLLSRAEKKLNTIYAKAERRFLKMNEPYTNLEKQQTKIAKLLGTVKEKLLHPKYSPYWSFTEERKGLQTLFAHFNAMKNALEQMLSELYSTPTESVMEPLSLPNALLLRFGVTKEKLHACGIMSCQDLAILGVDLNKVQNIQRFQNEVLDDLPIVQGLEWNRIFWEKSSTRLMNYSTRLQSHLNYELENPYKILDETLPVYLEQPNLENSWVQLRENHITSLSTLEELCLIQEDCEIYDLMNLLMKFYPQT